MLKLEVQKVENGIAECRYFFDSRYKDYILKKYDLEDCDKELLGLFIEQEFQNTFSPTPKRKI